MTKPKKNKNWNGTRFKIGKFKYIYTITHFMGDRWLVTWEKELSLLDEPEPPMVTSEEIEKAFAAGLWTIYEG